MIYIVLLLANMLLLTRRSLALSNPFCMPSSLLNTTLHSSAKSSKLGKQLLSPPSKFNRVSKNLPQKAPCKDCASLKWAWVSEPNQKPSVFKLNGIQQFRMKDNLPTPPWLKFLGLPPASGLGFFHLVFKRGKDHKG